MENKKRDNYQKRHKQNYKIKNSAAYYASKILW